MIRFASILAVGLLLCASFASEAANGEKKVYGYILVTNGFTAPLGVIVDPTSVPENQQQFENQGGIVVNSGATFKFRVKAGSHTVGAGLTDFSSYGVSDPFDVARNQQVSGTVNVDTENNNAITFEGF